jgi:hypothetical protein
MHRRGILIIVLFGLAAAGCGQTSSERPAVAAYLRKVQRIENALGAPLAVVTRTASQFAVDQSTHARGLGNFLDLTPVQPLRRAAAQIRALRVRLAAINAPAPATHLRALLLELCDRQAQMTDELAKIVMFLPQFAGAMRPFTPAVVRLERVLSRQSAYGAAAVAAVYASKASALRQFQDTMRGIVTRLHRLQVPAVSRPSYNAQVHALEGMGDSAGRLASAIADGPSGNVQQLLVDFDRAAASSQSSSVQRSQAAAARAYDAQSARLSQLSDKVALERLRLDRTLS